MGLLRGYGEKTIKLIGKGLSPVAGVPPIICASPGRSGSSLLFGAIGRGIARKRAMMSNRYAGLAFRDVAWELDRCSLRDGVVYKTHDLPTFLQATGNVRAVFIYGPPSDALLSVLDCGRRLGSKWVADHLRHLRMPPTEDLTGHDSIGFENQMRLWSQEERFPVLCVNYEKAWDHVDEIGKFLGLEVRFPPKRERRGKAVDRVCLDKVNYIYRSVVSKMSNLPDIFISRNGLWKI